MRVACDVIVSWDVEVGTRETTGRAIRRRCAEPRVASPHVSRLGEPMEPDRINNEQLLKTVPLISVVRFHGVDNIQEHSESCRISLSCGLEAPGATSEHFRRMRGAAAAFSFDECKRGSIRTTGNR